MPENKHGTADLELGQYNEVLGIVQRALPKAFAGVPYKEFCEVDGAVLEPLLHEAFLRATEGLVLLKRIASIAVPAVRRFVA